MRRFSENTSDHEEFRLDFNGSEHLEFQFGRKKITVSLDTAYELQYRLATLLAEAEWAEWDRTRILPGEFPVICSQNRKLDS